jgi:uncharacterized protein (TIGR00288 family)
MNQTTPRVMLLIDADNVTADVIEQAVVLVKTRHGAIHVRRAYCTAELALKQLKLFKAHSIRPIVNVSTGKNSTDIALAVDAMDLVVAERPDLVVIVSSDSDFAPLVIRLREKGCRVEGIGQEGKTGEDSKPVYDAFIDLPHRRARPVAGKRATRGGAAAGVDFSAIDIDLSGDDEPQIAVPPAVAPRKRAPARAAAPRKSAAARAAPAAVAKDDLGAVPPFPALLPAAAPALPAAKPAARKRAARTPKAGTAAKAAAPAAPAEAPVLSDEVRRILAALPELQGGARLQLNLAKERLCQAGLLAKSAPSTKLFRKHPTLFALTPEAAPNKVQYLRAG